MVSEQSCGEVFIIDEGKGEHKTKAINVHSSISNVVNDYATAYSSIRSPRTNRTVSPTRIKAPNDKPSTHDMPNRTKDI
jgi:hypothetical protein